MHKRIQHLPLHDRPREKLLKKGPSGLSDFELLQVIIGSGTGKISVGDIASSLKRVIHRHGLQHMSINKLKTISGMSTAKISAFLAAIEYVRRHSINRTRTIRSAEDVLPLVSHIRHKQREHVLVITLDGADCVLEVCMIAVGTLTTALVHPREVFADAITERAASIILVHNHPSGSLEPSVQDRAVTKQIAESGRILGIPLKDHIIVTADAYCSLNVRGLL